MREKGSAYLPEEPAEKPPAYQRRKNRSVFFNASRRTRDALVGIVYKKNPTIGGDVPPLIKTHLENIDLAGSHIDVFAKELFTHQFLGHVFILVDMDAPLADGATLEDEKATGRRPYWVKYNADQAFNWRVDKIKGEWEIVQITFEEKSCEPLGKYGEQEVTRYRTFIRPLISGEAGKDSAQYGPVQWELHKVNKEATNDEEKIILERSGVTTLNRIPVAVAYGRKLGMLCSEPPLLDLAYLNVAHWQEYSDYRNILHVAQVPLLCRKGASQEQQSIEIGPASTVDVPTDGDLTWVEVQGNGISAGRQELVDLEQRMAVMGLSLLSEHSANEVTATEKKMDWTERLSDLATMARSEQDAIELALEFHAEYLGLDAGGSIELGASDEELTLNPDQMNVLLSALQANALSLETWLTILSTQGALPDTVTVTQEMARIKKEKAANQASALPQLAKNAAKVAPPGVQGMFGAGNANPNGAVQ